MTNENQKIENLWDELDVLVESNPIPTLMWIKIRNLIITAYDFGYNEAKSKFATVYTPEVLEVINKIQNSEKPNDLG